jgi:hypothetical protein
MAQRYRFLLLLIGLLLTLAYGQDYYPSSEGLTWTYSNGETQFFAGTRELNGQQVTLFLHSLQGTPVAEDYLIFDAQGVRMVGTAAGGQMLLYNPPLLIYPPEPLNVGQSWRSTARVDAIEITLNSEVLGIAGVQTPAGRFNALQIRQQTVTSTGGQTLIDIFFVPGVGIVRTVTQDGTIIDLIEKNF